MKAFEQLIEFNKTEPYQGKEGVRCQETVDHIRKKNPELAGLSDKEIDDIWSSYSTHFYCAGYLFKELVDELFRERVVTKDRYQPDYYCEDFYEWERMT